jgi:hypothetical protein
MSAQVDFARQSFCFCRTLPAFVYARAHCACQDVSVRDRGLCVCRPVWFVRAHAARSAVEVCVFRASMPQLYVSGARVPSDEIRRHTVHAYRCDHSEAR